LPIEQVRHPATPHRPRPPTGHPADPYRHEELGRFRALEGTTWNHPVIAHGCLYVRNAEEMACYELAGP
jgi:hypothetical protein